jgi:hypothetical protein
MYRLRNARFHLPYSLSSAERPPGARRKKELHENRKSPRRCVFEDQPRLDVVDLRPGGEAIEGEVPQVIRVAHGHVNQEVVAPGHVEDASDLRQLRNVVAEGIHDVSRVFPQADRDHRLEPDAERAGFDIRVVASQHPQARETPHPFETRGRRHANRFGQTIVCDASILLQNRKNGEVDSVELVFDLHETNSIRFLEIGGNLLLKSQQRKNINQYRV